MEYLVIPKWKIAIEFESEDIEDIDNVEEEALQTIIEGHEIENEIEEIEIKEMTFGDAAAIYNACSTMQNLARIDVNKFLIFWLRYNNIDYSIEDEDEVKAEEYTILKVEEE